MTTTASDTLYTWPGSSKLPSIDPDSLRALALAQVSGHSYKLCSHPSSLDGSVPRIESGNQNFASGSLEAFFNSKIQDHGSPQVEADQLAYVALAHKLHQVTLHSLFRVNSNWTYMRGLFCTQYAFPTNLLVARHVAHQAQVQLLNSGLEDDIEIPVELQESPDEPSALLNGKEIDDIVKAQLEARIQRRLKAKAAFEKQKVILTANDLFRTFADKLGDRDFFYGELSTLDAHVYASIAPVLHLDLPSAFLREILSGYPTLIKHAIRVGDKLFSNFTPTQVEAPQFSFRTLLPSFDWSGLGSKTGSRIRTEKEKDLAVKRAWYILGVGSCLTAFVLQQGIIRLPAAEDWKGGDIRSEEEGEGLAS